MGRKRGKAGRQKRNAGESRPAAPRAARPEPADAPARSASDVAAAVDLSQGAAAARSTQLLLPLLLIIIGVVAYHNSLGGAFIFDDYTAIPDNPHLHELWPPWKAMSWPPSSSVEGRPVVALSLAVNYALGGLEVWGFHAFNVAWHILASLALFGIARRTLLTERLSERFGPRARWLALAVALLWLVHPLNTETVDYIIQRTEGLMGLFFLLTLYCVIRGATSPHSRGWYAAAVISCLLGTGSKEVMAAAPLIVVLYDRIFLSRSLRDVFRARGPLYIGLFASWLLLAWLVQATGGHAGSAGFGLSITPWEYLRTQAGVIVHYLRLSLWPAPLVIDYYDWPIASTFEAIVPAGAVVIALLGATAWTLYRAPALGFLGAWFFLTLAPTSSILPLIGEVAAERRMYVPLVAVVGLAVIAVDLAITRLFRAAGSPDLARAVRIGVLVVAVLPLAYLTVRRNEDYRTELQIWADAAAKRPNSARARNSFGLALTQQGRLDEAAAEYSQALRLKPDHVNAHNNLAIVLNRKGLFTEAVDHYSAVLRLNPAFPNAHYNIGVALMKLGRYDDAIQHFTQAVSLRPTDFKARHNLGALLYERGRLTEAIAQFTEVVRLRPDAVEAREALRAAQASVEQSKEKSR